MFLAHGEPAHQWAKNISGTEAAKQRSDAGTYTVCDTAYRMRFTVKDIGAIRNDLTASLSIDQFPP